MFRFLLSSDFFEIADSPTANDTADGFNVDDLRSGPVSKFWQSTGASRATLTFSLSDSTAVPRVIAFVNTMAYPLQWASLTMLAGANVRLEDKYPWNRIQALEIPAGNEGITFEARFNRRLFALGGEIDEDREWRCGQIIAAPMWRTTQAARSVSVSNIVPQLQANAETATPIVGVKAGRRRRVSVSWEADLYNDPEVENLFVLLDALEDRENTALIQPADNEPPLYYVRLESWSQTGVGGRPKTVTANFVTDGLDQTIR